MKDQIKGKGEELKGKLSGNRAEELKGKGRQTLGKAKSAVRDIRDDLKEGGDHHDAYEENRGSREEHPAEGS